MRIEKELSQNDFKNHFEAVLFFENFSMAS